MPISPNKARLKNKQRSSSTYKFVLKRIDEMLVSGGRTFALSLLSVIDAADIIADYESVGWKVRLVPDWRDGDYLEFSE